MAEQSPQEQVDQQQLVSGAVRVWRAFTQARSRTVDPTTSPEPAASKRKRFERIRPVWWVATILGIAGVLYYFHQPHRTMALPDGTQLDVIGYGVTRDFSINITSGERRIERQLVVMYWSDVEWGLDMRNEALRLAPMFYPVANANHVDVLVLKPSRPGFTRTFPVIAHAGLLRLSKDQTGVWREAPPYPH